MCRAEVVLRWVSTQLSPPEARVRYEALLSDEERETALAFRFEGDRMTYMAAHALKRWLLASMTGRAARNWKFHIGAHGKPHPILNPGEPDIRLNLSHSKGLAAVAVCIGHDIGVDVERIGRVAPIEVARHIFASAERDYLAELCPTKQTKAFYALWTLKEAYFKATGEGIALNPKNCAFALDPPRFFGLSTDSVSSSWWFRQFLIENKYMASLAVNSRASLQFSVSASPARLWADSMPTRARL